MSASDEPKGVCPVNHKPKASVCPVNHEAKYQNNDEPPDTDTDHTISHFHNMAKVVVKDSDDPHDIIPGMKIPATGRGNSESGEEWLNPSANQLYRSLNRKNKPIEHEDSLSVAAVHAIVTDQTWDQIMIYEGLHQSHCPIPKLARFEGRDGFYSPKAKFFHYVMGMPWPYDRHDWTVDRCGKEVEYVIDYYAIPMASEHNESLLKQKEAEEDEDKGSDRYAPFIEDENIEFMYTIDARPKMNSFGNMVDRIRIAYRNWREGNPWF